MKALTICQPCAELICLGEKSVENRGRPWSYRGPRSARWRRFSTTGPKPQRLADVLPAEPRREAGGAAALLGRLSRGMDIRDQAILYLTLIAGVTQFEVGALLGVSESRMSQLVDRALRRLRRLNGAIEDLHPEGA